MIRLYGHGLAVVFISVALAALSASADDTGFAIVRSSTSAGGTSIGIADGFALSASIGPPLTQSLRGGGYELAGGFWFELTPGDIDEDGTTSLFDYQRFEQCLEGPFNGSAMPPCLSFDTNHSGRVDLFDFAQFQLRFTGP